MSRVIHISGLFGQLHPEVIEREIWRQTRDMDSIVRVDELPRTGDGHKFLVIGTPR